MRIKIIIIQLLLLLGTFHAFAQEECDDLVAEVMYIGCAPDGSVGIQVSGGTPFYSSQDANEEPQGSGYFEDVDMEEGTYTYTFEDSNRCQVEVTFTIGDECCDFNAEVVYSGCAPDGWVGIQVTGGSGDYITKDGNEEPQGSGYFEDDGLDAGTYTYTFIDARYGCETDVTFTIGDACCDFNAEVVNTKCAPDGSVSIQVTGGSGNYSSYDGNEEPPGSGLFEEDGLDAGTYTYTYYDKKYGCETDVTFTIGDACCDFNAEVVNTSCAPEGSVGIQVTGGSGDYSSYDGNEEPQGSGLFEDDGLDAGTYTYTYYDDRYGCETDVTFTIGDGCCDFNAEVVNTSCGPEGSVSIQVTGGSGDYSSYDGNEEPAGSGHFEDDGLDVGTYTYTYYDSNGCETDVTFTIYEGINAKLIAMDGCAPNARVRFQVTGGTPLYTSPDAYDLGPGYFQQDGLDVGTYIYTFEDSNGCTKGVQFTISELEASTTSTFGCGEVQVVLTGGTPPYTSNYDGQQNNDGIFDFYLSPNDYELSFTDQNGCEASVSLISPAECSDFTSIFVVSNPSGNPPITMTSGVEAKLFTKFDAQCVPDRFEISVNGTVVIDRTAGSGNGPDCPGSNQVEIDSFCVDKCDEVVFTFFSDICDDDCNAATGWRFWVTDCKPKNGRGGTLISQDLLEDRSGMYYEESPRSSVTLFPNPASDVLTINKLHDHDQFSELHIINYDGKTLFTKNVAEQDQINLDISSIPSGIYFLQISNNNGKAIFEKFVKN